MPYLIDFPVGSNGGSPPLKLHRALYANLLKWFDCADAKLAKKLHARRAQKPLTISRLFRRSKGGWGWRVTLLQDDLFDSLWTGVQAVGEIDLNGRTWPVRWPDASVTRQGYDQALTHVRPSNSITLEFLSPTTFRQGKVDLPLPEPTAVFRSWLSRWNDFAPARRRMSTDLLEKAQACVVISAYRIRTAWHDLGHTQIVGFVGRVSFVIVDARHLNQTVVWQLNTLADYAEFCGTGRKTTHGMGQTRRIR